MSVKYLHYRHTAVDGSIESHGGITFAYVEGEQGISFATAQCSLNDNFNKKLGRAKAQGRLLSEKHSRVFAGKRADFIDQLDKQALREGMTR
ncbi:hypothetical protein [Xanthomonas phage DES1]|nr:hypothetical protein [Xanthomonas phage DES1]